MFHRFFLPELTLSEYFEKKIIDEEMIDRKATTSDLGDPVHRPMDRRCWKIVRPAGFAVIVHPEVNSSSGEDSFGARKMEREDAKHRRRRMKRTEENWTGSE